jgi:hypothetical protein
MMRVAWGPKEAEMATDTEKRRRVRLVDLCMSMPESERDKSGQHITFTVRGRAFAHYLDDHQGDGIIAVAARVPDGMNDALAEASPLRYYLPARLADRGWVALRLDVMRVNWSEVDDLVTASYLLTAPKQLAGRAAASG